MGVLRVLGWPAGLRAGLRLLVTGRPAEQLLCVHLLPDHSTQVDRGGRVGGVGRGGREAPVGRDGLDGALSIQGGRLAERPAGCP